MPDPIPAPTEADMAIDLAKTHGATFHPERLAHSVIDSLVRRCHAAEARVEELEYNERQRDAWDAEASRCDIS